MSEPISEPVHPVKGNWGSKPYVWGGLQPEALSGFMKYAYDLQWGIDGVARRYEIPPYREWFGDERPVESKKIPLRDYLLTKFDEAEVDAYFERRAAWEAEQTALAAWEASRRGRIVLVWREVWVRVRGAWDVLRHGIMDDY